MIQDSAIQARVASATTVFAGVRFAEIDGPLLYVYARYVAENQSKDVNLVDAVRTAQQVEHLRETYGYRHDPSPSRDPRIREWLRLPVANFLPNPFKVIFSAQQVRLRTIKSPRVSHVAFVVVAGGNGAIVGAFLASICLLLRFSANEPPPVGAGPGRRTGAAGLLGFAALAWRTEIPR